MYRPALALLLCFHIEVKNPWNEEQDGCLPQLPPFNWKMKQCHVEGRKFGLCASQQELLLSSTPLPCCWQPILPNQPGEHWPGCLSVWLHPGLLAWLLAHHCQLFPAQQHGPRFVSARPSSFHGLSAKLWLWEVHLHFKQWTDEEYDGPNLYELNF